ncbi:hypothetical protein Lbru_0700 [Legionella brunensis]|uniref:Uncharacterized protein n=1 Tax=Legionella brunensis TaxID=29422 RepID=A0A0W0STP5_9GAMM|nr:hypothetical protein Lbru_0700 [Legionella brunensis]
MRVNLFWKKNWVGGAYLTNLLKSIANLVIKAINYTTGSRFTLFTYAKGPMVAETEQVEQELKNNLKST